MLRAAIRMVRALLALLGLACVLAFGLDAVRFNDRLPGLAGLNRYSGFLREVIRPHVGAWMTSPGGRGGVAGHRSLR